MIKDHRWTQCIEKGRRKGRISTAKEVDAAPSANTRKVVSINVCNLNSVTAASRKIPVIQVASMVIKSL